MKTETTPAPRQSALNAAIARAKAKKLAELTHNEEKHVEGSHTTDITEPDNDEVIKQRTLRKEQARLHKQKLLAEKESLEKPTKLVSEESKTEVGIETPVSINKADDKKAKVAAVIAKAKAKKLAQKDQ